MSEYVIFEEGDEVRPTEEGRSVRVPSGIVTHVQHVPEEAIRYNRNTGQGGVGHPQWLWVDDYGPVSGKLLEKA